MNNRKNILAELTIVFLSICYTPANAQNMSPSDFLRESQQADQFIKEKHWDYAKRILLRLVATHHGREHEYSQLSYCYLNMLPGEEDFHAAELCARKAISLDPECGYAYAALAEARLGCNDYSGTIAAATKAVECKRPAEFVIYLRARAFSALNKYKEALSDFERYDRFISKVDKTQVNLQTEGELLEKMGRIDDAIKKFTADKPYHLEQATKNIVICLQKQKKYPEAIAEISTLIKRNPQDSDFYNLRATVKAQAKDWKGAIADYNHAISLVPTPTYYKNRAKAYDALGQRDLAKQDLVSAEK